MPVLDTPKTKTALEFWRRSSYMRSLPTLEERKSFFELMVLQDLQMTRDPIRRSIFSRMTPP
jgi:hypothetical protein